MDITCKRCGALIPTDDVDVQHMVAKCRSCNAVFSIADQFAMADRPAPMAQQDVPQPRSFSVEYPDGALRISWRWFTPVSIILAVVAVALFGFSRFWMMELSALVPMVLGFVMAYMTLTAFVNTTWVEVSAQTLSVRSGPLPTLMNLSLLRPYNQLYGPLPASGNLSLPRRLDPPALLCGADELFPSSSLTLKRLNLLRTPGDQVRRLVHRRDYKHPEHRASPLPRAAAGTLPQDQGCAGARRAAEIITPTFQGMVG